MAKSPKKKKNNLKKTREAHKKRKDTGRKGQAPDKRAQKDRRISQNYRT